MVGDGGLDRGITPTSIGGWLFWRGLSGLLHQIFPTAELGSFRFNVIVHDLFSSLKVSAG